MKTEKPFLKSFISALIFFTAVIIFIHSKEKHDFNTTGGVWLLVLGWHVVAGIIVGMLAYKSNAPWSIFKIFSHVFYVSFLLSMALIVARLAPSMFS
ncbi:hypothetical protein [Pedosphaera parvula]|uniref:Transmembrane protein n=1 Tax=Pedosphaera parvula (strain Ellin514) TaxID=320771 RepID=B9XHW3_PEDPL|nr:hypothetical protein [Pedosphaera parvula]EEF60456.1 hypothetical protein Cflav_PD3426 [Pedosphaera parvula Ellin514]